MRRAALLILALLTCLPAMAPAAGAAAPDSEAAGRPASHPVRLPVIRLHGAALDGVDRRLEVAQLEALVPGVTWKVWDPYRSRDVEFGGIRLVDLVHAVAPRAQRVRLRAVNDYVVEFARAEWETLPILLATRDDGEHMTVANKGPARIVFRQTRETELQMQVYAPKWIWQVIDVDFIRP